jgi:hypothetical protein
MAMLITNCGAPSGRAGMAEVMMRHMPIDSFGECLHTKEMPTRLTVRDRVIAHHGAEGHAQKTDLIARYLFTFAFENSISDDYITEKLWQPLYAGSVPVYYGAPQYRDFLPCSHCVIDARQFGTDAAGLQRLSEHILRIAQNQTEYMEYHAWRFQPRRPLFVEWATQQRDYFHIEAMTCAMARDGHLPVEVARLRDIGEDARRKPALD